MAKWKSKSLQITITEDLAITRLFIMIVSARVAV